jgi:hypothetical protein
MEKRNFVKLVKLVDLTYAEDTAEQRARWIKNVLNSVGAEAYGIDTSGYDVVTEEFSADEIEFVTVDCYNFMGSALEEERFYSADWITVQAKTTGDIYAYETEDLFEF